MEEILIAIALVFIASVVSTFSGFGLATIMVPILTLRYPLAETLLFVAVIHLFGDVWKIGLFRQGIRWRIVLPFVVLGVPMTVFGAWLVPHLPQEALARALGAFLLAYVFYLVFKPDFHLRANAVSTTVGGAVYGFFAGIFGVSGEIRGAVLTAYDLPKAVYLFTNGAVALLVDGARISTYLAGGVRLVGLPYWSFLVFIPVSFLGAIFAKRFVDKVPQERFRQAIAVVIFLAAVKLIVWP